MGDIWELNFDEIREAVDAIPAAEPKSYRMGYQAGYKAAKKEQKRGLWIHHHYFGEDFEAETFECSVCHIGSVITGRFCSNCGAQMGGIQNA